MGTGNPDWGLASILIEYLHSQGVVLKVEDWLIESLRKGGVATIAYTESVDYYRGQEDMRNDGYSMTAPLIEVKI